MLSSKWNFWFWKILNYSWKWSTHSLLILHYFLMFFFIKLIILRSLTITQFEKNRCSTQIGNQSINFLLNSLLIYFVLTQFSLKITLLIEIATHSDWSAQAYQIDRLKPRIILANSARFFSSSTRENNVNKQKKRKQKLFHGKTWRKTLRNFS